MLPDSALKSMRVMFATPPLHLRDDRARAKSASNDGNGPYSRSQLLRNDARFIARVERAFADGAESRAEAAGAIRCWPTP
jgi:hypothetical protein